MTIILFLIDTSASMSQEAFVNGVHKSYLDIAKGAVETFLKYRQRSQDCMGDRYMLLTFEEPPSNIKAGWKENHATFMNELKNLTSSGLTTVGEALKSAFDLLNLNRMQSGIDTYGQGRCPFYLEPAIIILITDGGKYSSRNGIDSTLSLPLNINIPGAKLTKEPFRWDQRLFSLILRMSGHKGDERNDTKVPHDDSPLEKMCEVTGGRSYRIKNQYMLNQCIEGLVTKAQPGVVINFDPVFKEQKDVKDGEMQEMIFQNMKKMIFVHKVPGLKQFPMGYWPIPESYWPDVKMTSLPPRDAHPRIRISLMPHDEPQYVRNFPVDKYELEPNQLTHWILSKKDPNKVYPLIIVNSNGGNIHDPMSQYRMSPVSNEMPFGYLKANSALMAVHYYVLPYNYQYLLSLISELVHKLNLNPTSEWINKFSQYVKNIPQYYYPFLRKALNMINVPFQLLQYILPESFDNYLSPTVANQLKQMKNMAKQEQENLCMRVFKQLKQPKLTFHQHETAKLVSGQPLKLNELVRHPTLRETFAKVHNEISLFENYNIVVPTIMHSQSTKNFRNPFDIPRRDLIDEILNMRDNFFKFPTCHINLLSRDAGHSLPISEMGNYQDYLKRREQPLKELEPTNHRQHMFGNPYKRDKNMVMVDEADDITSDPSSPNNKMMMNNKKDIRLNRKRKAGPIRKDYIFKRLKNEFGYPVTPGLPSAPSFIDSEDSDTASEMSYSTDCESVGTPSEVNEILKEEELLVTNGIVVIEQEVPTPPEEILKAPLTGKHSLSLSRMNLQLHDQQHQPSGNSTYSPQPPKPQPNTPLQMFLSSNVPHPATNASPTLSIENPLINNHQPAAPIVATPVVAIPPPIVTAAPIAIMSTRIHPSNDMNDAFNISKILQSSISNGTGSNSSISTNNNLSPSVSNDKRTHDLTKFNSKNDEAAKDNSKQNRQSKNKKEQKPPENRPVTPQPTIDSNNQHKHVNGDVKLRSGNKKLNNHHQNGEDIVHNEDQLQKWEKSNHETKLLVYKEIKKFGRDYSGLFTQLEKIKGHLELQHSLIEDFIAQCLRYKRQTMAKRIEEWWEKRSVCRNGNGSKNGDQNLCQNTTTANSKLKI